MRVCEWEEDKTLKARPLHNDGGGEQSVVRARAAAASAAAAAVMGSVDKGYVARVTQNNARTTAAAPLSA